jgi:hypothetical protein
MVLGAALGMALLDGECSIHWWCEMKWTPNLGQGFKWDTVQRNGLPMPESNKRRVHPTEFKAIVQRSPDFVKNESGLLGVSFALHFIRRQA